MTPDAIRGASHVMILMGIAAAIALWLTEVWRYAGWALVLVWLVVGIALDIAAARADHAHKGVR